MMASALARLPGFRSTKIVPVLPVLPPPAPTNATTWLTSGSLLTTFMTRSWRSRMAGKETSCGASETPLSMPTSCWGKSPLGMTM